MDPRYVALSAIFGGLVALSSCRKEQAPPPAPPEAKEPARTLDPWTWHRLGGLLVVEGEVDTPVELVLKGRYLNEHRYAEFGPVRWEMYAPPAGEVAELRTTEGALLAKWDFDTPLPPTPKIKPAQVASHPATPPPPPLPPPKVQEAPKQVSPSAKPMAASPWETSKTTTAVAKFPPPPSGPSTLAPQPKPVLPSRPEAPTQALPSSAPRPYLQPESKPLPLKPVVIAKLKPAEERRPEPRVPLPPVDTSIHWPGSGEALNLLRGPQGSHRVCVTFDGGSTAEVAKDVLDLLRERGLHTTFFVTGAFIQKYPDIVRRMDREGHEIGNHTMDHPHFAPGMKRDPRWTRERFQQQLLEADSALFHLLGRPMDPYWRAPFGEHTAELRKWAEEIGYRHVGWSEGADTLDWATVKERRLYRTGDAILDRLHMRMEKQDGDGLIVLMHLGSERPEADRPARVLGPFLDQALRNGWQFVTIGTYLRDLGKPRWEPQNRLALMNQAPQPVHVSSKR